MDPRRDRLDGSRSRSDSHSRRPPAAKDGLVCPDEIPPGHEVLTENHFSTPGGCSQDILHFIAPVQDLVGAISRHYDVSAEPDTFGVREAASELGCSPGFVGVLVHEGKLRHHWLGKNLRFHDKDIEDFWASQTNAGANNGQKSRRKFPPKADRDEGETNPPDNNRKSAPAFLSTKEIRNLWR
jgi:excisionase family DNA binding protein